MAVPFSDDGSDVINRKVTVGTHGVGNVSDDAFCEYYEVESCARWISERRHQRVAVQIADELLVDAARLISMLEAALEQHASTEQRARLFVLGDTSYGACCVDEVAAQHGSADAVIHVGRSCLSPTQRLPVRYVFGRATLDVGHALETMRSLIPDRTAHIVLVYDTVYAHAIDGLAQRLDDYTHLVVSSLALPETQEGTQEAESTALLGRVFAVEAGVADEAVSLVFVGASSSAALTSLMMAHSGYGAFMTYDPERREGRRETVNVNQALMRRYYMVERARNAAVVGIVAGTLGVRRYLDVIAHLRTRIERAGKKAYTFVMGKLNVAKMANFQEIDCFVLVACAEHALLDSRDFFRPVVTPFEMDLACRDDVAWTGAYSTDFRGVLADADATAAAATATTTTTTTTTTGGGAGEEEEEAAIGEEGGQEGDAVEHIRHSLVSQRLYSGGGAGANEGEGVAGARTTAVAVRMASGALAVHSPAASFLAGRSFQGLEPCLGQTPVVDAIAGQTGIARAYTTEHPPQP